MGAKEAEVGDYWDLSECDECTDGMLNLIGCQGAPVIISLPHFLNAEPRFSEAITGLNPDEAVHTTFLNVEPYTGNNYFWSHTRVTILTGAIHTYFLEPYTGYNSFWNHT